MINKATIFLLMALCLAFAGCGNKDAEINAFIAEYDAVSTEIKSKVDASPNSAGVEQAQKAFDAKKAALKTKWDAAKDARGMQVSEDVQKKLEASIKKNTDGLIDSISKMEDPEAMTKFQKLLTDITTVISDK